jgi:WD40 repeat protein
VTDLKGGSVVKIDLAMESTAGSVITPACPGCGAVSELPMPSAAAQPFLDQLRFANPQTLAATLAPGESVLVQCHAALGALVGTNRRLLVIKNGKAYGFTYSDLREIKIEKVGWWLSAVCQLVTATVPYRPMKSKEADAARNAVSLVRNAIPLYEKASALLLEIRDTRRCPQCGAFVPLPEAAPLASQNGHLLEPLGFGEAETLQTALQPGEHVACQIHGARYAKALVVTDARAIVVIGGTLNAFDFGQLEDVDVTPRRVSLVVKGQPRSSASVGTIEAVRSDHIIPCDPPDMPKFQAAADLIRTAIRAGRLSAPAPVTASQPVEALRTGVKTLLGHLDLGVQWSTWMTSRDSQHVLWISRTGTQSRLVVDDEPQPEFDDVELASLSDDSRRFAYVAHSGDNASVMLERQAGPPFQRIGAVLFSPDGGRLAYMARTAHGWVVVVDDRPGSAYADSAPSNFLFSPDGVHLAYGAQKDKVWIAVLDGQEQEHRGLLNHAIAFSPDSKRFAYQTRLNDRALVVVDGQPQAPCDGIASDFVFSPDSRHFAYIAIRASKHFVVTESGQTGPYDGTAGVPLFSPDSSRLAYTACVNERWQAFVGSEPSQPYDDIVGRAFSPDSRRFGFAAVSNGKQIWVTDGQKGEAHDLIRTIGSPFSPDCSHCAYIAGDANRFSIILDGEAQGPSCDQIDPNNRWTADSRHIAWIGVDHQQAFAVVDGAPGEGFDAIGREGGIVLDSADSFHYIGVSGVDVQVVRGPLDGATRQPIPGGAVGL